jgi:PIN domain nuclease of toxin-antitoxin system
MILLLDTCVWIWAVEEVDQLGKKTRHLLQSLDQVKVVSPISTIEVTRLVKDGRVSIKIPLRQWVQISLSQLHAETTPFTHEIAIESYQLPGDFHRDPSDRLLVATARILGATFVTVDERILGYPHVQSWDARK